MVGVVSFYSLTVWVVGCIEFGFVFVVLISSVTYCLWLCFETLIVLLWFMMFWVVRCMCLLLSLV